MIMLTSHYCSTKVHWLCTYHLNRIRNLEEKISELEPDGQVVKGITDYFCQTDINRLQDELEAEKERVQRFFLRYFRPPAES